MCGSCSTFRAAAVCDTLSAMPSRPRMRPVFEIPLDGGNGIDGGGVTVLGTLRALLASGTTGVEGQVIERHAVLQLPAARRTLLSPFLNLEVTERDGRPVLKGRFSPHPNVWTGFLAVYLFLGMAGTVFGWYGLSQWTVDEPPTMLLGVPGSLAAIAFVYGAAVIGQGLTADEMYDLRALVDRAVREGAPGRVPQ